MAKYEVGRNGIVQEKAILIKGKIKEKGVSSFYRCGIKFSDNYQELEVDEATLEKLKLEPKLIIQVVK